MSRRVGIGSAVVLVLLLLGSFVCGLVLERVYGRIIDEAQAGSGGLYEISGVFQRGWLSSSAQTRLVFPDAAGGEPVELPLEHDVVHGPIPLAMLARGGNPLDWLLGRIVTEHHLSAERLPRIASALGGRPFVRAIARIGMTGIVDVELESPSFELEDGSVSSEGLEGELQLAPRSGEASGTIRLGAVRVRDTQGVATLDGSTFEFASEPGQGDATGQLSGAWELGALALEGESGSLRLGSSSMRFEGESGQGASIAGRTEIELGTLEAKAPEGEPIALRGLKLVERREVNPSTAHREFHANLSFEDLEVAGDRFGPGTVEAAIRNIDADAFEALREAAAAVEAAGDDEMKKMEAQMSLMSEQLPAFLSPSPEVALEKLHLVGESGALDASLRFGVDGSDPSMLGNPFMLLSKLQASASLDGPVAMLEAALDDYYERSLRQEQPELDTASRAALAQATRVATLDKLTTDGTLIRKGDRYTLEARLEEGLPIINGVPADPTFLMGILPGF